MSELSPRAKRILYAVMTEFLAHGEPVGSRTLARKYCTDLSAATIRNVLSDLELDGYLQQPHTSAGRVPTAKAFRTFIDALLTIRSLSSADKQSIEQHFLALEPGDDALKETAKILSQMTGSTTMVVAPRQESQPLRQIRFMVTRPGELLAVVVTMSGLVENRFIRSNEALSNDELQRIHNILDEVVEGRTLGQLRTLLASRISEEREELSRLNRRAFELGAQALQPITSAAKVLIEGQTKLFEHPEFADLERIKQLMKFLEERQKLLSILDTTLESDGVQVVMPTEDGLEQLSLVATRFCGPSDERGSIAVIGPTRMDYANILPIVDETVKGLEAYLSRRES